MRILVLFSLIFFCFNCSTEPKSSTVEPKEISTLAQWLAIDFKDRPPLEETPFADTPLSKAEANRAMEELIDDYQKTLDASYGNQWTRRVLELGNLQMPFYYKRFGTPPSDGSALYISLHGGGGTTADVNDQQYNNQKNLYDQTMLGLEGIIEQFEPQNMVTYFENQLIIAEVHARAGNTTQALTALNQVRTWLNNGGQLNANFSGETYLYAPFIAADFENGGIENQDNISAQKALLREIIEERYVSGFGMHISFNDARRLRKADSDISVPFVMKNNSSTQRAERLPYAYDELNSNENAPEDPGIFQKTPVNQ